MEREVIQDITSKMDKAVQVFIKDLTKVRTGRAHLSLLDGVKVHAYDGLMPLNQVNRQPPTPKARAPIA